MLIMWKARNIRSLLPLKDKNDYKSCVIYKEDCSCSSRYIGEPNVMQKLDGMNIIIQLNVQKHQNTFEATLTTILHGLSYQILQKMLRAGRT